MRDAPIFLTLNEVILIHERMIAEFGGEISIRDQGLLESATMMPMAQFGGKFLHEDIPAMGAAYLFHICKNHAFVDGNKRTALAAAEMFIRLNGKRLVASDEELERLTRGVAQGNVSKDQVTGFFKDRVQAESDTG